MPLPIDNLTTVNLDAATDDPSQARPELLAAVMKIKEIIAAISAVPGVDKILASDANGMVRLGNVVGIGTAPDTNHDMSVVSAAVEVSEYALMYSRVNGAVDIARNAKLVGGQWVYRNSGEEAALFSMSAAGAVELYTAAAGTAGAAVPFATRLVIPATIPAGFLEGGMQYLEAEAGSHPTGFNIVANILAAWESVGPTGSGATNIWTALDSVPAGAKWIEVRIYMVLSTTGSVGIDELYARRNGSTVTTSTSMISTVRLTSTGATSILLSSMTTAKIPLNANRMFDLYRSGSTLATGVLILSGFGM